MNWPFLSANSKESAPPQEKALQESKKASDILNALPFPAWILDCSLKTIQVNDLLVNLAGLSAVERRDLLGYGVSSWFRSPEVQIAIASGLKSPVVTAITIDGRSYDLHCTPIDSGQVLVLFQETTSFRRAEQARTELVANVSHELRTPLTSIRGFAETLKEDVARSNFDSTSSHVEVILRNVDRLRFLIDDLLLLSRLESGLDELQVRKTSTREVTEHAIETLLGPDLESEYRRIEIRYLAPFIWGDSQRIEQVLLNLVGNALRYSPEDVGPILIEWSETSSDVTLSVSDAGPGIPIELQHRVFERFFRVDSGRSREMGGTGLGLSIVKHIISRHGGEITLKSSPGKGCRFTCRLPKPSERDEASF